MKRPHAPTPAGPSPQPFVLRAVLFLVWAERIVFFAIGLMLFVAALLLLKQSAIVLFSMATGSESSTSYGSQFLDVVLLVLMIVELAYTVILSLRGAVLLAEPFLIVGLIAVIRRILVITVGEARQHGGAGSVSQNIAELGILTAVVIVFVGAIALLRVRPKRDDQFSDEDPLREIELGRPTR
ncbi:MAG: hypothetical protein IAI50_04955 [Candidatus Eremiobacteraeota bacterium]|nr:hypothetical protein [Candidatus Eremiobacteraeota bacterium]